ncbi:retention module-containing protein [Vibrio sp. NTOU-M3]|uniref:retention module-containing protein n=1 Tax=Vibrio sp. NTOU-M3 TaxID=3234954 RepID=UPI00349F692C
MAVEVIGQQAVVQKVTGEVIAVEHNGNARIVNVGEILERNEILITVNRSSVVLVADGNQFLVDENCLACLYEPLADGDLIAVTPINGEVSVNTDLLNDSGITEDDFAAIQDAILAGADPTQLLEAPAAGAGASGSANAGFVTINYNFAETIASTFFETAGFDSTTQEEQEQFDPLILAAGGEGLAASLQEGTLSQGSYPQSTTVSVLVNSGDLPLDPTSFVPEANSLAALLAELNSDITSAGEPVTFRYDAAENAIIGEQGGNEVVRIDIDAVSSGVDVSLSVTATISQPIDHNPSVGGGQVSIAGDQIIVNLDVTGADNAGNEILSPIDISVGISDGSNPLAQATDVTTVESESASLNGTLFEEGSDQIQSVVFTEDALAQFDDLLSDNQAITATLSDDKTTITVTINGTQETVLTVSVDANGQFSFQQNLPLEQVGNGDDIELSLPVIATDFDQDTTDNTLNVTITDGQNPTINATEGLDLSESGVAGGSEEGVAAVTDTGTIDFTAGSDAVDHFELEPSEFNQDGALTSQGQAVMLELASNENGVRTYNGYIIIDGQQINVFEVKVDSPALGQYEITLLEQLDHLGADDSELSFNLPIYAVDADGDRSSIVAGGSEQASQIVVTVTDDEPSLVDQSFDLTEPVVAGSEVASYSLFDQPGADGAFITSFTYGTDSYTLRDDLPADQEQAFSFAEGTLYVTRDGNVRFEVARDIDHSADETIQKQLQFTATDVDGDTTTSDLTLNISDGALPEITSVENVDLAESALSHGSAPGDATQTAEITFTEGSDDFSHFRIDVNAFNTATTLTSDGQNVTLVEVSQGVYQATITDASGTVIPVFRIEFDANSPGKYTFTLQKELDHSGSGNDDIQFTLPIYAVDTDGDDSAQANIQVTIKDDIPTIEDITAGSVTTINESHIATGSDAKPSNVINGEFVTEQGADEVVSYQLANKDAVIENMTSSGEPLTMTESVTAGSTTYQAMADGKVVFELILNSDGSYSFELKQPLDHDVNLDDLLLNFKVTATDGDGDVSAQFELPITVTDDKPSIDGFTGENRVDEDDLASGSDTVSADDSVINGHFDVTEGADEIASYELVNSDAILNGLSVDGSALEWAAVETSGTQTTYTAVIEGTNTPAFKIIFDASDNSYRFELLQSLDHADGAGENELTINITVVAKDYDGDSSDSFTLPVTVVDDVPTLTAQTIETVEGSRNPVSVDMFATDTDKGADGASLTQLEGVSANGVNIMFGDSPADINATFDIPSGESSIKVYEVNGTEIRELGELTVNSDGQIEFVSKDTLQHQGDDISFTINVTATDGDKDTSTQPVEIVITDEQATMIPLKVVTFEDSGRNDSIAFAPGVTVDMENAEDNLASLPDDLAQVALSVNLHDADNNESIGGLTIHAGDHHGTFFYEKDGLLYELTSDASGNIHLPAELIQQSATVNANGDTIATIDNLYFVPDRHFSTSQNGFDVNYTMDINNNGSLDHSLDGNFKVEVERVADIATWDDNNSTYHYSLDEDDASATLHLTAQTQDDSQPEAITYQLTVTEGTGNFVLIGADGQPIAESSPGVYLISAADINSIKVDPNDNFSGQIRFDAVAITEERNNAVSGKETAESEVQEVIIDVSPVADEGSFSVNRVDIFEDNASHQNAIDPTQEHDPLLVSEVVTMTPSPDQDSSESMYVRISDFSVDGVELVWLDTSMPSQITQVTLPDGSVYYEIPEQYLDSVEILPPLHSNQDFTFNVEGIIKDQATLSDGTTVVDETSLGSKEVNVAIKGVADTPEIVIKDGNTDWSEFTEGDTSGIKTTIDENGTAELNFSVVSGEYSDKPLDQSESLTVLLSNIPEGVVLEDSDGTTIDLTFVGYDSNGQPIYEADISALHFDTGIVVRPVDSATANIEITATIVVTEDDGHSITVEKPIVIEVAPVIDTQDNYLSHSRGNEDSKITINWQPEGTKVDADEFYADLQISGVPSGASVFINGEATALTEGTTVTIDGVKITFENGELSFEPDGISEQEFSDLISQNGFIQIQPEADSSADFTLTTTATVKEIDAEYEDASNPGQGIAEKVVNGQIDVTVVPVVEPEDADNKLEVTDAAGAAESVIHAGDDGSIEFTINDANGDANIIHYLETDSSSDELVTELVVQFNNTDPAVLEQLVIVGAVYEGNGRWVITDEENFSIKAPNGLNLFDQNQPGQENTIDITIFAKVTDAGEDSPEAANSAERETDVTLSFPKVVNPHDPDKAADVDIKDTAVITGTEDNSVNLGEQLADEIVISGHDGKEDIVTIVIDGTVTINGQSYPISISANDIDFTNGKYVFQGGIDADGNLTGFDGLNLNLPEDFSGDFELPITIITTDVSSGDEKTTTENVTIQVSPVADTPDSTQPNDSALTPEFDVAVSGSLDENMDPIDIDGTAGADTVGYEDSYIQLAFTSTLMDNFNGVDGGDEVLSEVTLTLADASVGQFYDADGNALGTSITFSAADIAAGKLDQVLFKPAHNYPTGNDDNTVTINVSGTVTDTATFDQTGAASESDSGQFNTNVSFEVVPVVDDIEVSGAGGDGVIDIVGTEDEPISLATTDPVTVSLTDTDGSEQFISLKLTDVPDGFLVQAVSGSGYTVKNNGNGEWSIKLPAGAGNELDLSNIQIVPPKDFSGHVDINMEVFTQENLLGVPVKHDVDLPSISIDVQPKGDVVDVDPVDTVEGIEGEDIQIDINAQIVDNKDSLPASSDYQENEPETLRVEISGVPDGATISIPGVTPIEVADGKWVFEISAQQLDNVVFNSGDNNHENWDGKLQFNVQSKDTGVDGTTVDYGPSQNFEVSVDVSEVNDAPETKPVTLPNIEEDQADPMVITSADLLANASDIESHNLTVSNLVLSDPAMGTLVQIDANTWHFVPAENYYGDVSFSYDITDDGTTDGVADPQTVEGNASFTVEATNDAPEIEEGAGQKISGVSVSDVDYTGPHAGESMSVTLSVDYGVLSVVAPAGSSVVISSGINGEVILEGSISDINALLSASDPSVGVFVDTSGIPMEQVQFTVKADDQGVYYENASGMVLEDEQTFTIDVKPVAQQPSLSVDPDFNYVKHIYAQQSVSNQGIALVGLIAVLADINEVLALELTNVPDGATLMSSAGSVIQDGNVWKVSEDAIESLVIRGAPEGAHQITVTAVSTESDDSTASSDPVVVNLEVTADSGDVIQPTLTEDALIAAGNEGATLQSGSGNDRIEGGDGADHLIGGEGNDTLLGGAGVDVLEGGLGSDILTGGTGADVFVWRDIDNGAQDTITDFNLTEGDQIDLREVLPELQSPTVDMDALFAHLDAKVVDSNNIELTVHADSTGGESQTIVVENLGQQIDFSGMDSAQIVNTLLEQNVIMHDT